MPSRWVGIQTWGRRLVSSIVVVGAVYGAFSIVAHALDPRWPPAAFGWVRTGVSMLTWPGRWTSALVVVAGVNPFPRGWAYSAIWLWSVCAYTVLVFVALSLLARARRADRTRR